MRLSEFGYMIAMQSKGGGGRRAAVRALWLGLALALGGCATTGPQSEVRFIYLDPADTLQIDFHYSPDPRYEMAAPSVADSMRRERQRLFLTAIHTVMPIASLPMGYRVLDPRERPQEGHPVLRIHAYQWEVDDYGELKAVISVTLHAYGERNELGTYDHREQAFRTISESQRRQQLVGAMIKSLTPMLNDLVGHFESPMMAPGEFEPIPDFP